MHSYHNVTLMHIWRIVFLARNTMVILRNAAAAVVAVVAVVVSGGDGVLYEEKFYVPALPRVYGAKSGYYPF